MPAALAPGSANSAWAPARVALTYLWRHRRIPDLCAAPRFTEMVQRRKLHDRDPRHPALMDKLAAKQSAAELLGRDWTTQTLWQGPTLPDAPPFAVPAMLKARHGCNQYAAVREAPSLRGWQSLQARTAGWLAAPYGRWLDEWAYRSVPRELIAEPLLGDGHVLPVDYKIYVFGGRATHVQVHLGRGGRHRWILHDASFRPLVAASEQVPRPGSLAAMLGAAETLGADHEFLRIDFYEIGGRPLFGEFCLYPGSGLDPFAADWIDLELGALWHRARGETVLPERTAAFTGRGQAPAR